MKPRTRWLVGAGCAVAVIALATTVMLRQTGHVGGHRVTESAVDGGFARDMAVHHAQAVEMASYTRDHAPTAEIRSLASIIATQQQLEVGQMLGWLEAWGLPRASEEPAMSWMAPRKREIPPDGHHHGSHGSAVMPGMATPAQMDALVNLQGRPLEVRFLQLMIRHHQGGLPMARHAAEHAGEEYVRQTAGVMVMEQAKEIDLMGHLLSERGGRQLPAPPGIGE